MIFRNSVSRVNVLKLKNVVSNPTKWKRLHVQMSRLHVKPVWQIKKDSMHLIVHLLFYNGEIYTCAYTTLFNIPGTFIIGNILVQIITHHLQSIFYSLLSFA